MSINLHGIARGAISRLHPEIEVTLYRSISHGIDESGGTVPAFAPGVAVSAQMQSESTATLYHADKMRQSTESRKFYLFSKNKADEKITGIHRPLSRGGDVIKLLDGSWWLVDGIVEDFSQSGWVSVRATLQVKPPMADE